MTEPQDLTHDLADDILTAVRRGRVKKEMLPSLVLARSIGPAIELAFAIADDPTSGLRSLPLATGATLAPFARALGGGSRVWAPGFACRLGFYRTLEVPETRDETDHTYFLARAAQAAEASGFPKKTAKALVGAMGEIEGNIYEHSGFHQSGIVAFQGGPGIFSFVIADGGIGVLASLRQSRQFQTLDDHGDALRLALTDGVSRYASVDPARGMGFHGLFVGIASLRGSLRFATGDHALVIDGRDPALASHRLVQKSLGGGFVVSVTCQP